MTTAVPLTQAAFAPYGTVLQNPTHNSSSSSTSAITVNQSTALKFPLLPSFSHSYPPTTPTPDLKTSIFVCSPRDLVKPAEGNDGPEVFPLSVMERHPHSPQAFIPLGLTPGAAAAKYLVLVAADKGGRPDWENVKAFVAHGSQGVVYGAGVWHSPMVVLGSTVEFVVIVWENGVAERDCVEVKAEKEVEVQVLPQIGSGEGGLWGKSRL